MDLKGAKAINIVHTNVTAKTLSRHEIIDWINGSLTATDLQKVKKIERVEELCSAAHYCLVTEKLFGPGTVNLTRVKYDARLENEFIHNFKILQVAFNQCQVDKESIVESISFMSNKKYLLHQIHLTLIFYCGVDIQIRYNEAIPIEKLIKGRYNDNYDFAQWFKMFNDANRNQVVPEKPEKRVEKNSRPTDGKGTNQGPKPERARRIVTTKFVLPPTVTFRRPATAAPAMVTVPTNFINPMATVELKIDELSTEVKNVSDTMQGINAQMDFLNWKLTQINELCLAEAEDKNHGRKTTQLFINIFDVLAKDFDTSSFSGSGNFRKKKDDLALSDIESVEENYDENESEVDPDPNKEGQLKKTEENIRAVAGDANYSVENEGY